MIESVSINNIKDLLPLMRQYQAFYHVTEISDAKNEAFLSQFGESSQAGCQFLFREQGNAIGFATVYFSFTSTVPAKVAILNDLYTSPAHRGKGVGKQLIEHCRDYASVRGAARLQWVTAPDNKPAQALYRSLDTDKSTWCFYTYKI